MGKDHLLYMLEQMMCSLLGSRLPKMLNDQNTPYLVIQYSRLSLYSKLKNNLEVNLIEVRQ